MLQQACLSHRCTSSPPSRTHQAYGWAAMQSHTRPRPKQAKQPRAKVQGTTTSSTRRRTSGSAQPTPLTLVLPCTLPRRLHTDTGHERRGRKDRCCRQQCDACRSARRMHQVSAQCKRQQHRCQAESVTGHSQSWKSQVEGRSIQRGKGLDPESRGGSRTVGRTSTARQG